MAMSNTTHKASMRNLKKSSKFGWLESPDHREEKADFRWTIQLLLTDT